MGLKSGTYRFYIDGDRCFLKQGSRIVGFGGLIKTKTVARQQKNALTQAEARLRAFNFTNTSLSDTP